MQAHQAPLDPYAWAAHYLQEMSKAVIDDVVKVLESTGTTRQ